LCRKKKKKDETIEDAELEITESEDTEDSELDLDEDVEVMSEEDILESLSEDDGEDETDDESEEIPEAVDVTKTPTCFEELADIVASKKSGAIQYMKKSTGEVFSLREYHFRYARVLGAVSMGREIAPTEYARITLAGEVLNDIDDFYILPSLSDDEMAGAVIEFCDVKCGINGKKYIKNPDIRADVGRMGIIGR
jgi:hypothetical protein